MTVMVASISPSGSLLDPKGISLDAPTIAFITPFTTANSDTAIGMAPDTTYQVTALANWSTSGVSMPMVTGSQSDQGHFIMPDFDDALYAALQSQGYTNQDLYGESRYTFRTGPFRITSPKHHGFTNATTAPGGAFTAHLQFAQPVEGIAAPTSVTVTTEPNGLASTTTTMAFPSGTADSVTQDGTTRLTGVTQHDIPLQLPPKDYDDDVTITMEIRSNAAILGKDRVRFHHDVIVPTIDPAIAITNTYIDGKLDSVCLVADCDVVTFLLQVQGGQQVSISTSSGTVSACTNDRAQYCFSEVSLGLPPNVTEGPLDVTFQAVDDAGNVSPPVTVPTTPTCKHFDRFVAGGGQRSAVATADDGTPLVAWTSGATIFFSRPNFDGNFNSRAAVVTSIATDHSFGLGIDMALDPLDRQPIICFVDAAVDPDTTDASRLGTLHVWKMSGSGFSELSSKGNVRPLGCSVGTVGTVAIVGWSEPGVARWGLALGVDPTALDLPSPPDAVPEASDIVSDVDIAGDKDGRVYFAYRTAHPTLGFLSSPGRIMAGYIDGAVTQIRQVCPTGATCATDGQFQGSPSTPLTFGYGPQIMVDDKGVGLAYISAQDGGLTDLIEGLHLEVLSATVPMIGFPIGFSSVYRGGPDALDDLSTDGLSTPSSVVLVPFARPSIVRGLDGRIDVAWARGWPNFFFPATFGSEDVAVVQADPTHHISGEVTVIDRRVATTGVKTRTETVETHLSTGPNGYNLVYRSPAVDRLVFVSEQVTVPVANPTAGFVCPGEWQTSPIPADEINLKYAVGGTLFLNADCANINALLPLVIHRPWSLPGFDHDDLIGKQDTLLRDIATPQHIDTDTSGNPVIVPGGLFFQNGRGVLMTQRNICLPMSSVSNGLPDFTACGTIPTSDSNFFSPPAVTQSVPSVSSSLSAVVAPKSVVQFPDLATAQANCTAQVVVRESPQSFSCIQCPPGTVFDPPVSGCVSCPGGDFRYDSDNPVNFRLPVVRSGISPATTDTVQCVSCPPTAQDDLDHGVMPWTTTPDGSECTRCTDGSVLTSCASDDDCLIYSNARCAQPGWNGRANHPGGSVCVRKCSSDADCTSAPLIPGSAHCDTGQQACVGPTGSEQPAGTDLLCRPIGCDQCWQNNYCTPATETQDCPRNHRCFAGPDFVLSPACVLRPVLSPAFKTFLEQFRAADPTDVTRAESSLDSLRLVLIDSLLAVRLPNTFQVQGQTVVEFDTRITDVSIRYVSDAVVIHLDMAQAGIQTDSQFFTNTDGPWDIEFWYGVFSKPSHTSASDVSSGYSGLGFSLVAVLVHGQLVLPFPAGDRDLSSLGDVVQARVGSLADQAMDQIVNAIGSLRQGSSGLFDQADVGRCIFVPTGSETDLPHQCPDQSSQRIQNAFVDGGNMDLQYEVCP